MSDSPELDNVVELPPPKPMPVAIKYTVDGPIEYYRIDGKDVAKPLVTPEFEGTLEIREDVLDGLHKVISMIEAIRSLPKRELPLTRKECEEAGIEKRTIKKLAKMGLLEEFLIGIVDRTQLNPLTNKAKAIGARPLIFLTAYGRSYLGYLKTQPELFASILALTKVVNRD